MLLTLLAWWKVLMLAKAWEMPSSPISAPVTASSTWHVSHRLTISFPYRISYYQQITLNIHLQVYIILFILQYHWQHLVVLNSSSTSFLKALLARHLVVWVPRSTLQSGIMKSDQTSHSYWALSKWESQKWQVKGSVPGLSFTQSGTYSEVWKHHRRSTTWYCNTIPSATFD